MSVEIKEEKYLCFVLGSTSTGRPFDIEPYPLRFDLNYSYLSRVGIVDIIFIQILGKFASR